MEAGQALITAAEVQPLVNDIVATVEEIFPVLLTVVGIFLAIKFVPGLIRSFTR